MRKPLSLILSLALLLAPALPALAADAPAPAEAPAPAVEPVASPEAAATPGPDAVPTAAPTAEPIAEPTVAPTPGPEVPERVSVMQPIPPTLPTGLTPTTEEAPEHVSGTAELDVPKEELVKPGEAKPEEKASPYKLSNFVLGFLGGALLGGAAGVLSSGGQEGNAMGTNAAIYGGGAALALGLAGLFLGATTPEEAKPPRVDDEAGPLTK